MTEITINLEQWSKTMGVAPLILAYYDLENRREMDEWRKLVHPDCTYTAPWDGEGPITLKLLDVIETAVDDIGVQTGIKWIAEVEPLVAFAQWEVEATLATGESLPDDYTGVNKYEFNEGGQLIATTGFHLFPGMVKKFAESSLDLG